MKTKLAGHLPLQDAIARTIEEAREKMKLAAAESEDKEKAKKLLAFEKKEHGHIPSVKEEKAEYEKQSSVLDVQNPEEVEKLAAALDEVAEKVAADGVFNGGESHQGGEQLATMRPVGGKQSYSFGQATKKHQVPNSTGTMSTKDNPGASTAVPTDDHRAPGGTGAKYPPNGVLRKTAFDEHAARMAALGSSAIIHGVGGAVGYHSGKAQKERGEKHTFGVPQAAGALFLPGGLGYQVGRYYGHQADVKKGKKKHSSVELLQDVLAAETGIEKEAGKVSNFLKRVGGSAKAGAKRYGQLMAGGAKGQVGDLAGKRPGNHPIKGMKQWRSETLKSTAARAGTAAAAVGAAKAGKGKSKKKHSSVGTWIGNRAAQVGKHLEGVGKRTAEVVTRSGKGGAQNLNPTTAKAIGAGVYGGGAAAVGGAAYGAKKVFGKKEKKSEADAVSYILNKISAVENGGESKQGGEQLSNTAPVPSNPGRQMISSNSAPASATKREAKAPQKKLLKEVLTEPAQTKSTDPVVQNNLRNASKGGVKIAAARAFLQKIAEEGCTCEDAGACRYCKMQKAVSSKPAA